MVVLGSAHLGANKKIAGDPGGDQTQRSIPDYSGEVSFRRYNGDAQLQKSNMWNSYVFRPTDPNLGSKLASRMITACNNPNLGYNQYKRDEVMKYGVNASHPICCDCSSLVRACIKEASGVDPGPFDTAGEKAALAATGLFQPKFRFKNLEATPLYIGDILVTVNKGHTVIVTDSSSTRDGQSLVPSDESEYEDELGDKLEYIFAGFSPRTTPPILAPPPEPIYDEEGHIIGWTEDVRDLWYVPIPDRGKSIFSSFDETSYIWGRFSEVMNFPSAFGKGSLGSLYAHVEDGYRRGVAASFGAIMCFTKPKTDGWAGVVESIDPEGSVTLSYVDKSGNFRLMSLTKRYGVWDFDGYKFVGFIQNPGVSLIGVAESAKETFIRIAEEQVGSDSSWTYANVDITDNNGWSAAFVTACSAAAGSSLNIVIPNVSSCSAIGRVGILRNMGEWISGPANGKYGTAEPGDIVLFRKTVNKKGMSIYDADHAGIVSQTNGGSMTVIEGDVGDIVKQQEYSMSSSVVSGYFRPKWDIIDGTSDSVNQYRDIQGLYTNGVSINDAAVREVCYLNSRFKPSIVQSKLKLSVVNYTGLLGNMYSVFAQSSLSDATKSELVVDLWSNTIKSYYQTDGVEFDISAYGVWDLLDLQDIATTIDSDNEVIPSVHIDVTANAKRSYEYLTSKGLSPAAACGVLGNIKAESNFNTAARGDKVNHTEKDSQGNVLWTFSGYTSFGICQWHNEKAYKYKDGRGERMKKACGSNWYENLTAQLDYLLRDLNNYSTAMSAIRNSPNTKAGAKNVADKFVRDFERPSHVDSESKKRQSNAASYWDQLVN